MLPEATILAIVGAAAGMWALGFGVGRTVAYIRKIVHIA